MNISIVCLLLVFLGMTIAADELSIDEIRKLKIADLKKRLKLKGLVCNGCAEKEDFVNLFVNNQNLPDVVEAEEASKSSSSTSSDSSNSEPDRNMAAEEV